MINIIPSHHEGMPKTIIVPTDVLLSRNFPAFCAFFRPSQMPITISTNIAVLNRRRVRGIFSETIAQTSLSPAAERIAVDFPKFKVRVDQVRHIILSNIGLSSLY